jgi:hypothetical protein
VMMSGRVLDSTQVRQTLALFTTSWRRSSTAPLQCMYHCVHTIFHTFYSCLSGQITAKNVIFSFFPHIGAPAKFKER